MTLGQRAWRAGQSKVKAGEITHFTMAPEGEGFALTMFYPDGPVTVLYEESLNEAS